MTHSYDKICLERASDSLGRMLDYSFYSLHYDVPSMMDLFIASGTSTLFERGEIKIIAGMSGIELAYHVMEKSGLAYERTQPRHTRSLSPEYWCGYALARIQWASCSPFDKIIKGFSIPGFISGYAIKRTSFLDSLPLDTGEAGRAEMLRSFALKYTDDAVLHYPEANAKEGEVNRVGFLALKRMREKNGLSQSALAGVSGIPVRTIQQYEQGQKDISKARAEYLLALARALNCDPEQLLSNQQLTKTGC